MIYRFTYREVRDFYIHQTHQVAPAMHKAMREDLEELPMALASEPLLLNTAALY
jgi:hypothetical protein